MTIYVYKCKECKQIKEIDKPIEEQYYPTCCGQKMYKIIYAPYLIGGCLNGDNLAT